MTKQARNSLKISWYETPKYRIKNTQNRKNPQNFNEFAFFVNFMVFMNTYAVNHAHGHAVTKFEYENY